ncbi:hypothetical protein KR093_004982 [Drosophila rubida]|uniref:aralkylamine N-acetyltransferase n=1 Tax=Drosophila rubida TaxID=30044 RepID=A0AAD4K5G0_9MUSC|nr:hypothetical protein KR093_004982 [Drosophila rubida]
MSTNFGLKNGILIRLMEVEDCDNVTNFLGNHFYNAEPLCVATGVNSLTPLEKSFKEHRIRMIEQGTCLIALDTNNADRIVGVVLAQKLVESELEEECLRVEKKPDGPLKRMLTFLTGVELRGNVFKHYGVSEILYSLVTNVDTSMRGKGLGTRLAAALMEVGRSKGYPLMSATCSSFYSARQKLAMGMECFYSDAYADYKDANGEALLKPPAPHTHIQMLAIKL